MSEIVLQNDVKGLISKFIKQEDDEIRNSQKKGVPILKVKNNTLTLYYTRIGQKEGEKIYIVEPPKKSIPNKLYGDPYLRTVAIINFLRKEAEENAYMLESVPFELDYHDDLKVKVPTPVERNSGSPKDGRPPAALCRNVIFSGTPGAGKSYFVDHFAIPEILSGAAVPEGQPKEEYVQSHTTRVTFTEGYTREDFFGCYKPMVGQDRKPTYAFAPGPFCRAVRSALAAPEEAYVLVIEELNRGNVYEILGDVFQLLDRGEDGSSSYPVALSMDAAAWFEEALQGTDAAWFDGDHFRIPGNLYIICTMNNADARVQFLDTAFKRRFSSAYMDEEGCVYGAGNVPGVKLAQEDAGMKGSVFCVQELMSRERYDHIRRNINNVLQKEGCPEDQWIAARFIRFDRGPDGAERLPEMEFVTNVLGYLLQNVFRGREKTAVFQEDCPRSLGLLLRKYCKEKSLKEILADDILK